MDNEDIVRSIQESNHFPQRDPLPSTREDRLEVIRSLEEVVDGTRCVVCGDPIIPTHFAIALTNFSLEDGSPSLYTVAHGRCGPGLREMALTAHHTGDGWDFSYIDQFDEYVCLDKFFPSPKNWITDDELEDLGFDVV